MTTPLYYFDCFEYIITENSPISYSYIIVFAYICQQRQAETDLEIYDFSPLFKITAINNNAMGIKKLYVKENNRSTFAI